MIADAFYALLNTAPGVKAIADRIYPYTAPMNAREPLAIYRHEGEDRTLLLNGQGGWREARMTVDCYAARIDKAEELVEAVQDAVIDVRGNIGGDTSIYVSHARLEQRGATVFETDTELYRVPVQFLMGYKEA